MGVGQMPLPKHMQMSFGAMPLPKNNAGFNFVNQPVPLPKPQQQ